MGDVFARPGPWALRGDCTVNTMAGISIKSAQASWSLFWVSLLLGFPGVQGSGDSPWFLGSSVDPGSTEREAVGGGRGMFPVPADWAHLLNLSAHLV